MVPPWDWNLFIASMSLGSGAATFSPTCDKAAITFGCHPETMRRHYLVIDEIAIAHAMLERVQRVKRVEDASKKVESGSKSVEKDHDQGAT